MKLEKGLDEEEKELLELLKSIQKKYKYPTPKETVSHYLKRIYPDPATLDDEDFFYYEVQFRLEKLLTNQEAQIKTAE